MGMLADQTFSAPLPVTVSAFQTELPAMDTDLPWEQAEYGQEMLAHAPERLELPADRPRTAQPDDSETFVRLTLDEGLVATLHALQIRHRAIIPAVRLAGWAAVLDRLLGQSSLRRPPPRRTPWRKRGTAGE